MSQPTSDGPLLPVEFCVQVEFLSDWHVGSGTGQPGYIDRLVLRDADGLPFIPAKTLRGIWRDACERLCRGLDDGQRGPWTTWVDLIFGSQPALAGSDGQVESLDPTGRHADPRLQPLESPLLVRPARYPGVLRQVLLSSPAALREMLTILKPGVSIDPRSGSAREDFLRFEELARVGSILSADCRLLLSEGIATDLVEAVSALLTVSASLVERLGGKRRRGSGRCRWQLLVGGKPVDCKQAVEWLSRHRQPPPFPEEGLARQACPRPRRGEGAADVGGRLPVEPGNDDVQDWVCIPYRLELLSPVSVSARTVGNVVETLDFIPGWFLLPHLTRSFPSLADSIAAGDVQVLPAYIEVSGRRGLPVPMALHELKDPRSSLGCTGSASGAGPQGAGGHRPSRLASGLGALPPGVQYKQLRDGYVTDLDTSAPSSLLPSLARPPIGVFTHNTVEDQVQRPTENVGGVYSYEAILPTDPSIAPGQQRRPTRLAGEIRVRRRIHEHLGEEWWLKLQGNVELGRSKKDDYGHARLALDAAVPAVNRHAGVVDVADGLLVWLLTDLLLRDKQLQWSPTADALAAELSRRLNVHLLPEKAFVRVRRHDGWQQRWGLPRPTLLAMQAGSCMKFQVEGTLNPSLLAEIEASGIGERRGEGFGQVRFNPTILAHPPEDWAKVPSSTGSDPPGSTSKLQPVPPDDPAFKFARLIEREAWKREIQQRCLSIASSEHRRRELLGWQVSGDGGSPPMSQLGGLRDQVMRIRKPDDADILRDWLNHLEETQRRLERWPGGKKAIESIRKLTGDPQLDVSKQAIWRILSGVGEDLSTFSLTEHAESKLRIDLWAYAVRTFFDACIRAHKRDLERKREQGSGARQQDKSAKTVTAASAGGVNHGT